MHDQVEADVSVLADVVCGRGAAPKSESEEQAPAAQKPPHRDTSKIFSHIKDFVVQRVSDLKPAPARWLWPGRPRPGWGIVRHPKEQDKRLLLPLKMNLGPPAAGLEFKIADGRIEWERGPTTLTAEAVSAAERWATDPAGAEQWLQTYLANGRQPAKEVVSQARECGISERTLDRDQAVLGYRSEKRQFDGASGWFWSLESDGGDANETVAPFENDGTLR